MQGARGQADILDSFADRRNSDPFTWAAEFSTDPGGGRPAPNPVTVDLFRVPESYPMIVTGIALFGLAGASGPSLVASELHLLANGRESTVQKNGFFISKDAGGAGWDPTIPIQFNGARLSGLCAMDPNFILTFNTGENDRFPARYFFRPGEQVSLLFKQTIAPAVAQKWILALGGFILR